MPNALNLFPARVPIGSLTGPDGRRYEVLMTTEFSRALADLLTRVGGASGMDNGELAALASSDPQTGQVLALRAEVAELRAMIEQVAPTLALHRQIEAMRVELAMIEDPAAAVRYFLTNYASLLSPHFKGIPTAPTAALDTDTDQLATTKFVLNQAGDTAPLSNGAIAAPGGSERYARADHVHPTDASRQAKLTPQSVTGARTGNTPLTLSLLAALVGSGLIINDTTP
jgi:hypothetical protein